MALMILVYHVSHYVNMEVYLCMSHSLVVGCRDRFSVQDFPRYMVHKLLMAELGRRELNDRDYNGNKRLGGKWVLLSREIQKR